MQSLHDRVVERLTDHLENDWNSPEDIEFYAEARLDVLARWLADKAFELWVQDNA